MTNYMLTLILLCSKTWTMAFWTSSCCAQILAKAPSVKLRDIFSLLLISEMNLQWLVWRDKHFVLCTINIDQPRLRLKADHWNGFRQPFLQHLQHFQVLQILWQSVLLEHPVLYTTKILCCSSSGTTSYVSSSFSFPSSTPYSMRSRSLWQFTGIRTMLHSSLSNFWSAWP